MRLGNFSVSLAVKDIAKSRELQGMFSQNTMTFNPGWDRSGTTLPDFDDVRDIQRKLKERGLTVAPEADDSTTGPASPMVLDPDGNPILIDQHVARPHK